MTVAPTKPTGAKVGERWKVGAPGWRYVVRFMEDLGPCECGVPGAEHRRLKGDDGVRYCSIMAVLNGGEKLCGRWADGVHCFIPHWSARVGSRGGDAEGSYLTWPIGAATPDTIVEFPKLAFKACECGARVELDRRLLAAAARAAVEVLR